MLKAVEFGVLGPVEARSRGQAIELGRPKQRALLAALLLRAGEAVPRDRLVDALWGDDPPATAVQSLQVYVSGLRKALGAERIETRGTSYRVVVQEGELDLQRFEAHVARGELDQALALWRGPALADLTGEPLADSERPRLEELRLHVLELRGAPVGELEALVAEHPYREGLRRQLVLALYRAGRQADALDAYRAARRDLDELGIEPSPELRELEQAILRQDPELAAPERAAGLETRLPTAPTPLVGRQLEVAAVTALLRDEARLVTLTGPGGTGKTRLALAVAEELAAERPARFVDLSALRDPGLIGPTIEHSLGVDGPIADQGPLLLVLDNFEQLLDGAPHVAGMLAEAPALTVVATSRAPLRLSAEHEYPVPTLPPADAVALFSARARAVDPAFVADESVAEICERLDGLPLALELAAARTKLLPPEAMVGRLERSLELLTGGARDLPPRQRTLEATLDWSHELLAAEARELFAQLSVFRGGWTLDAAEAVAGRDVLADLGALVDENLVRRSGTRFTMLETIREYAVRHLDDDNARRRHAEHFLALAEVSAAPLAAGAIADELDRLDAEHDNLRAALEWAAEHGETELEARIAIALRQYWIVRGELAEAQRVFEGVLSRGDELDPELRALAFVTAGVFPYRQGDVEASRRYFTAAADLYRELDDPAGLGRATAELGAVAIIEGDLDRAVALYETAVAHFRDEGAHVRLGIALSNLGALASMQGDLEGAARYDEEAIPIQREAGDRDGLAISLHNLGRTEIKRGRVEHARELLGEALETGRALGYKELIAHCLVGCAELAAPVDPERAARLVGAALAIFDEIGVPLVADEKEDYLKLVAALEAQLGAERLADLDAEGRDLPRDQAIAEGLAAARP